MRNWWTRFGVLALGLGIAATAMAQKYPAKPVTLIVPQAAGGANDAIARVVAQKLSEQLGQSFVIENRVGAGGNVGTAAAAKARPDGYTIMLTADSARPISRPKLSVMLVGPWLCEASSSDTAYSVAPASATRQ